MMLGLLLFGSALAAGPEVSTVATSLTIAPGIRPGSPGLHSTLHGVADLQVSKQLSLRGGAYLHAGEQGGSSGLAHNHTIVAGIAYHLLPEGAFDPYLALEPGIAVVRTVDAHRDRIAPLFTAAVGARQYVGRTFHLLGEVRSISGRHLARTGPVSLAELRFSVGLGLNFQVKKGAPKTDT
jgi:hypothetical protein